MKTMKRRLLSLLMAMVMVCSLMPAALADNEEEPVEPPEPTPTHTHIYGDWQSDETSHWKECTDPDCPVEDKGKAESLQAHTWATYRNNGDTHSKTCNPCGYTVESEPHTYGKDGKCACGATEVITLTGIAMDQETLSLAVGGKATLAVKPVPASAELPDITWSSTHEDVAEVSQAGVVTAKKVGTTTINATAVIGGAPVVASCYVTVTGSYELKFQSHKSSINIEESMAVAVDFYQGNKKVDSPQVTNWEWTSSEPKVVSVTPNVASTAMVRALAAGGPVTIGVTATLANGEKVSTTTTVSVNDRLYIRAVSSNISAGNTFTNMNQSITLEALLDGYSVSSLNSDYYVDWQITSANSYDYEYFYGTRNSSANDSTFTVAPNRSSSIRRYCTVVANVRDGGRTGKILYTAQYALSLQIDGGISLTATVNDEYYLGDVSNKGTYSVYDQLINGLSKIYGSTRVLDYVIFENVTSPYGKLDNISANTAVYASSFGNIKFVPITKGDAIFRFTAYVKTSNYYPDEQQSGILTITVSDTVSGGDITFYGSLGDDVYMNSAEFDDFWDSKYPGGTLDYVVFGSVSGGSLLDGDDKAVGSRSFYVSPTRTQLDLDDVHFRPSSKKAATYSFTFTAHGEKKGGGSATPVTGTVRVVYMSSNPSDIKYALGSDNTVRLKASDFTAAYKEATGSSAPSNLTIVFQGVPRNGSLTYTDSSKKNSSALKLTSSNIRSRNFTTLNSGSNQIGDVVYTGSASYTDTIDYIAYSGNTPKFKGSVVFGGSSVPTDILVSYSSANGQAAKFSWTDFTSKSSALSGVAKVRFTAPANGTLYLNGVAFAASTELLVTQVSGVSYVPKAGSNNQEKLAFFATDSAGKTVGSGTVVITVTGNAPVTTNPGGVTSASQFKDVTSGAWYYTYLDDLVRKGIVSGRDDGTFDPNGTVTYGEALKLVLEAAGHSATATTGNEWAINYKNLAVTNGWISNDIVLTNSISRIATAELIARVLGVSQRTGDSPFADTTNGYAAALYYTSPQIFIGNTNPNGGKPLFNNSTRTTLTRAEVCTIIYRMNSYHLNNTSVTMNPSTGLPVGI